MSKPDTVTITRAEYTALCLSAENHMPVSKLAGWFNHWNENHGYQQVSKESEGAQGTIPLFFGVNPTTVSNVSGDPPLRAEAPRQFAYLNSAEMIAETDAALSASDRAGKSYDAALTIEKRHTFVVPVGYEAVRDQDGRATGEVRPTPTPSSILGGRTAELEAALEPFSRAADLIEAQYGKDIPDWQLQFPELTMSAFRQARSAFISIAKDEPHE